MLNFFKHRFVNLVSDTRFSEILTGSIWALGARIVATALGMVSSIIIARAYGAEVMGTVAVLGSFLMLTTLFTVLGTNISILRLIPEYLTRYSPTAAFQLYRKIQFFVVGVSVIIGGFLFLASGFVAETIFSKPHLKVYFSMAAVFIVFNSLKALNTEAVRGLRLIRVFAFMQLLPSLSTLALLALLTIFFFHPDNPIYVMFASVTITAITGSWIMDWLFKRKTKPKDIQHSLPMKEILVISIPMFIGAALAFVIGETGVIMLGIFRPEAEVGYYAIAVKLATLTSFVITAVSSLAAPKMSELFYEDNMNELFYVTKKATKLIFWTTAPILLGLILLGKPIIFLLYGADFTKAYLAMVLLATGQFVNSIAGLTSTFMNMTGHQNILLNISIISAISNIGLNFLFTPTWGLIGAAFAGMLCVAFANITVLFYIKKKFDRSIGYFPYLTGKLGF